MTDAEVQKALQALSQLGAAAGNSRASIQSVGQSMARLRMEMQRGTGTIQGNAQALSRLQSEFEGLRDSARNSAAGQAMLAEQSKMAGQIMRDAAGQMSGAFVKGGVIEAVSYFKNQVIAGAESYTSGVSGTTAALRQQQVGIQSNIDILNRLSNGLALAAEGLALIPNPAARIGAVSAAAASGITALLKEGVEAQKKAYDLLGTELSATTIAYQTQTKAGMAYSDGMRGMRDAQASMLLTTAEQTNIITKNKEQLVQFGGSLYGGIARVRKTNHELNQLVDGTQSLREQLYRVGISYEDQSQGIIDYIALQQQSGTLEGKTSKQLAEESAKYMVNMKALSAYTGEDAKAAQARAQAASEQLAVQAKLRQSQDPEAMEKFQTMIKLMPADMQKGMQQMTAFDGNIIDKNLNILLSQSPTRKKVLDEAFDDFQKGIYTSAQLQERQAERMKKYGADLEKEGLAMGPTLGAVNLATGQFGEVVTMAQNQVKEGQKGQNDLADKLGSTVQQFEDLKKRGTDPLTESVIELDTKFREVQMPGYINAFTTGMTRQVTQGGEIDGPTGKVKLPTLLEQNQQAMENTVKALEMMKFLKLDEIPPVFSTLQRNLETNQQNSENTTRELGTNFSVFSGATDRFGAAVDRFGQMPAARANASENLAGGTTGSDLTRNDQTGIAFRNPAGMLENLVSRDQSSTNNANNLEQMISGLFNTPNLMTNSLTELKNTMTADSQATQSLMKQYTDKMDTLIAAMEDNVDYSKRIADNIA
jgi:hypothetical protein